MSRLLLVALQDMHLVELRHRITEGLLKEMVQSRSEAAELSKKYDTRWVQGPEGSEAGHTPKVQLLAVQGKQWVQQLLGQAVAASLRQSQHCLIALRWRQKISVIHTCMG